MDHDIRVFQINRASSQIIWGILSYLCSLTDKTPINTSLIKFAPTLPEKSYSLTEGASKPLFSGWSSVRTIAYTQTKLWSCEALSCAEQSARCTVDQRCVSGQAYPGICSVCCHLLQTNFLRNTMKFLQIFAIRKPGRRLGKLWQERSRRVQELWCWWSTVWKTSMWTENSRSDVPRFSCDWIVPS